MSSGAVISVLHALKRKGYLKMYGTQTATIKLTEGK